MKKKLLLVCMALLSLFSAMATVVPTTSTAGNDVWYHIKCSARNTPTAVWLTGAVNGGNLTVSDLTTADDSQLWKVVVNTNGFALVNKQFGTYMNTDVANTVHLTAIDVVPTTALQFVPSITKVGGVLVNDANTVIDVATNVPATTPTFTFYAAGSGYSFHPANLNGNYNPPLEHSSVYFMTSKEMLAATITDVTASLNNSSEGLNPGQVSPEDREALSLSIDDAITVRDNPASTDAQFLTALMDLNSILSMFKTKVILPELSTGTDNWYFIQGTRPAGTYMTGAAAGTGTQVKDLAVIPDDTQLWRLVPNGDGFAMQNKASLEYMQTDFPTGTNLSTQATMPTKALRFITSTETYNKAYRFWIENTTSSTEALRLHAGGSGNGWGVMNWTGGANDNCTWLFLSYDELFRTEFSAAKTDARALYDSSVEGVEFGQYSTAARTAFNTVLAAQEAKNIATMTQEELKAGTKALKDAMTAFECNGDPATLSSVTKIKWFRLINNPAPSVTYSYGKAMSSNGRTLDGVGVAGKFTFETKDVNSDAQLFRFEMNADGTKATTFVNKANGYYMGTNGAIVAAPAADNEFEFTRLDNNSFWIKPTSANPLHAAQSGTEILNWWAESGSASAWRFEYVKSEDVTDFTNAYATTKVNTRAKYDAATLAKGDQIGQYTTASVNALGVVITAEEAKDAATLTQTEKLQGINDMNAAVAALVINTDVKLLVSTTPNTVKWFRLINGASTSVAYASGKAMSSNGRIETEAFTFEDKDINSDAQLFKFELNAGQTKVANMINKSNGLYMSPAGGMISKDSVMKITNEFEITQLAGGRSFWIHPTMIDATDPANPYRLDPLHAAENGTMIVNWNAGAGSASAWLFEFVKEEATAVKNVEAFTYRVRTTNHIITIDGVENFEVYSVLGQKQNSKKALNNGVYFVKVNNAVKKVVID